MGWAAEQLLRRLTLRGRLMSTLAPSALMRTNQNSTSEHSMPYVRSARAGRQREAQPALLSLLHAAPPAPRTRSMHIAAQLLHRCVRWACLIWHQPPQLPHILILAAVALNNAAAAAATAAAAAAAAATGPTAAACFTCACCG